MDDETPSKIDVTDLVTPNSGAQVGIAQANSISELLNQLGFSDPRIIQVLAVLKNDGKLSYDQIMALLGVQEDPRILGLKILSKQVGTITVADLINSDGAYGMLLTKEAKDKITKVVSADPAIAKIYASYGSFKLKSLMDSDRIIEMEDDLLSRKGRSEMKKLFRKMEGLKEYFETEGRLSLNDMLSDRLARVTGNTRAIASIRSIDGKASEDAVLEVSGAFRGDFGDIGQNPVTEVIRVRNVGAKDATGVLVNISTQNFVLGNGSHNCHDTLAVGAHCEIFISATAVDQGAVSEQMSVTFNNGKADDVLSISLEGYAQ